MNAQRYIVSVIHMLQQEFGLYSLVTPGDFDVLYRWWEKGVPLKILRDCTTEVVHKRQKQGKEKPGIRNLVHGVRKAHARSMEQSIGKQGQMAPPISLVDRQRDFFARPPEEIADLVSSLAAGSLEKEGVDAFYTALLKRFEGDEELQRRCEIFSAHLAPALRSEALLNRYRINLLIGRFAIPDLESGG